MGRADVVSRNLTTTYVRFRNDRRGGKGRGGALSTPGDSTHPERSLLRDGDLRNQQDIEMQQATLPPQWVDSVEDAREDLKNIKEKLVQLTKVQQKRLLNVFSDDGQPDKDVEEISLKIGKLVRHCESCIHQVKTRGSANSSDTDQAFRENAQRNLATQLQKLSQQFRQSQKDYLDEIRKRQGGAVWDDASGSGGKGGGDAGFTEGQLLEMEDMEVNASQRSEEICQIATSISELHTIFKELAVLVIDQGSILDRIDYNIEQVVTQSKEANKQLQKAEKSQKSNRATKCMLALVLANAILILIMIFKARH